MQIKCDRASAFRVSSVYLALAFSLSFVVILLSSRCVIAHLRAVVGGARKILGKWVGSFARTQASLEKRIRAGEFSEGKIENRFDLFSISVIHIRILRRGVSFSFFFFEKVYRLEDLKVDNN